VVLFGAVELARHLGRRFTSAGDVAFIELGVRQAIYHGNALGVYSRFGWHHPGPALFYMFAPAYWLSGESSRSLFLSAWLINGAAALGAVVIVRSREGEVGARILALVLFIFLIVMGFAHFLDPWNPKVLSLPLLLLMVSAAAAYSGSAWSFVVALGAASYLIQTHLGTMPVSVTMLALGTVGFVFTRRNHKDNDASPSGRPRTGSLRGPIIAATCVLALFWIGPLIQQVSNHNGNLTKIARFYRHPTTSGPISHSVGASIQVVADHASSIALGPSTARHHAERIPLTIAFAALGLVVAAVARRAPFLAAMGLATTVGLAAAVVTGTRVVGTLDPYLFYWTEALPIPAIVAGAAVVLDRLPDFRHNREISAATIALTVGLVGVSFRTIASASDATFGDPITERAVAQAVEQDAGAQRFTIHVQTRHIDRGALFLQLDKDGYRFHVDPMVDLYRGNITHAVSGPNFVIGDANGPPPDLNVLQPVAAVGKFEVFTER
jgi:hypothetical protein